MFKYHKNEWYAEKTIFIVIMIYIYIYRYQSSHKEELVPNFSHNDWKM